MILPKDVIFQTTLKPGAVFLYHDDEFPDKAHFFVVINTVITHLNPLLLVSATSQLDKRKSFIVRNRLPTSTLVIVNIGECVIFSKPTAFNCNNVLERQVEVIKEKIDDNKVKKYSEIPTHILEKIRNGVLESPLVPKRVKMQLQ